MAEIDMGYWQTQDGRLVPRIGAPESVWNEYYNGPSFDRNFPISDTLPVSTPVLGHERGTVGHFLDPKGNIIAGGSMGRIFLALRAWYTLRKGAPALPFGKGTIKRLLNTAQVASVGAMVGSMFGEDVPANESDQLESFLDSLEAGISRRDVLMPASNPKLHQTGDFPKYFHVNLENGQMWMTWNYKSGKSIKRAIARESNRWERGVNGRVQTQIVNRQEGK